MREKYESLSVAVLRDLAKSRGIAKVSTMKKAELIEAMVAEDEKAQPASEDAKNIDEKKKETTEEKNETRQHRYPRQQNGQYHENRKNDGRDPAHLGHGLRRLRGAHRVRAAGAAGGACGVRERHGRLRTPDV